MNLFIIMMVAVILMRDGCNQERENFTKKENDIPQLNHYPKNYKWGQLKIGGGGYVTGIVIHPKNKNIMYIRTDVGGVYRWNKDDKQWIQMLNWIGPDQANLIGVDGMALDPNDPNRIYLALGKSINGIGGVYRSEDQGKTWKRLMSAKYAGNGRVDRWTGECIAVDPNNSNIIYAGTRTNGLWRSTDDGVNWSKVSGVPDGYTGYNPIGIRSIVFDPAIKSNNSSPKIYVGIPKTGIYQSIDGGKSFSLMTDSPKAPARMQVINQELFVTHGAGVALWSNGSWQNISPVAGKNYVGLAVDEKDDKKLVVAQRHGSYYNPIYRSTDKGNTWQQINTAAAPVNLHVNVPWWPKKRFSAATACMAFSHDGSGELYYTDWFGVWQTPDIWSGTTNWYIMEAGHEETGILTLVAPSKGALVYSGMPDNFGFRHQSLKAYPRKKLYPINEGFSIAVCEKQPSNIAILGAKDWNGRNTVLSTSSDYGETWIDHTLPAGSTLGRIAISSADPDNMIYVAGGGSVYYSLNNGNTWQPSQDAPDNAVEKTDVWNKQFILAADCVNNNFYLFNKGLFYASTNEGKSWTVTNKTPLPYPKGYSYTNVAPSPDKAGVIWISLDKGGLWKTTDGGKTFSKINFFESARLFSWGAEAPGNKFPTAYCYGTVGSKWGLYRSTDMGKTWVRINDDEQQFLGNVKAIAGDRHTFGQIYVGTGGNGIFYGKPVSK